MEFVAATPDGLGMKAGDLGDALESAVPPTLGFASGDPATLLLIQSAEQQVELPMIVAEWMVPGAAVSTTAIVNGHRCGHIGSPSLE